MAEQEGGAPEGDGGAVSAEFGCWQPLGAGEVLQSPAGAELVPPAPRAGAEGTVKGLGTVVSPPQLPVPLVVPTP